LSTAPPSELRAGEKRDRLLGTLLMAAGLALLLAWLLPISSVGWIRRAFMSPMIWLFAGYQLRNSYAENLGEAPAYRTPRVRRIGALVLFVLGLIGLVLAFLQII